MRRAAAAILLLAVAAPLFAARAPDSYERTFYWRGVSADRIAALFGMSTVREGTLRLRESYELYAHSHNDTFLMDSEKRRTMSPPVWLTLHFVPGRPHRLTMEGWFFDGGSSIPQVAPRMFLTSWFVPQHGPAPEGWAPLFDGREETRRAGAPFRDVTVDVFTASDYDAPGQPQGFLIRVTIADE